MRNINKRNLIVSLIMCVMLPVIAFFLSMTVMNVFAIDSVTPPTTYDELKVQSFLLQENSAGISNATKLGIDPNDTSTWIGFTFNASGQLTMVGNSLSSHIDSWDKYDLHGGLDVSECTKLTSIYVSRSAKGSAANRLTEINVRGCSTLKILNCSYNQLDSIYIGDNTALTELRCDNNSLEELDVGQNMLLQVLSCHLNGLTELDITYNTSLIELRCYENPLGELNVSQNTALQILYCYSNNLTELDITNNTVLKEIRCGNNPLGELDISQNTALQTLFCYSNNLSELDVANNTGLKDLRCYNNPLDELNVAQNTALQVLICYTNNLTELDISQNTAIQTLNCYLNRLTELDVTYNTDLRELRCYDNPLGELDISQNTALQILYCNSNNLTELDVTTNIELKEIDCYINNLSDLDVRNNTGLKDLRCGSNPLGALDIRQNTALQILSCYSNNLDELDVSQNTALQILYCYSNNLSELDVTNNIGLKELMCNSNPLGELDVAHNTALQILYCYSNNLTELNVTYNTSLRELRCNNNSLGELDVSRNTALQTLECYGNSGLKYLNVSGNAAAGFNIYWLDNTTANRLNLIVSPLNKNNRLRNPNIVSLILFPYANSGVTKVSAEITIDGTSYDLTQGFAVSGTAPKYIFAQAHKNYASTFTGWTDENDVPIAEIGSGSAFNNATDVMLAFSESGNTEPTIYYIDYENLEGADNNPYNPLTYNINESFELQDPGSREGYTFIGWYDRLEGGNKVTTINSSTGNITLYARWQTNALQQDDLPKPKQPNNMGYIPWIIAIIVFILSIVFMSSSFLSKRRAKK